MYIIYVMLGALCKLSRFSVLHLHLLFRYNVNKLAKSFIVSLSLNLWIDGNLRQINLLQGAQIPIPICNSNATFTLPGDGTVDGYLAFLKGMITDEAVDLVLDSLDLKVNALIFSPE